MTTKRYDCVDDRGNVWASDLPDLDSAHSVLWMLKEQNPLDELRVVEREVIDPEGRRYGRDPDLH